MKTNLISGEIIKTKKGVDSQLVYIKDAGFKGNYTRMILVRCTVCNQEIIKALALIRAGVTYNCGQNACRDVRRSCKTKIYKPGDMVTSHYRYVEDDLNQSTLGNRRYIKIICICGRAPVKSIRMGHTTKRACKQCGSDKQAEIIFGKFPDAANNGIYRRYIKSAKARKISFDLDYDFFVQMISRKCFYCKRFPFKVSKESKRGIKYNGIDRLDRKLGYVMDNVKPCCEICNPMKNTLSYNEFIDQVRKIAWHLNLL